MAFQSFKIQEFSKDSPFFTKIENRKVKTLVFLTAKCKIIQYNVFNAFF